MGLATADPMAQVMALRAGAKGVRERRVAQASLASFTERMFSGYTTSAYITDVLIPALEWAVNTPNARLIVTMPPRHSKSLHVSEHLPAWFLGNHPDKRIIAASHTASLAYTFSRRVRNKVSDPRWPFPHVRVADDKGAVQAWDIDGDNGGYIAVGVGGSPTGHGGHLIVIDDPIRSAADADSEVVREGLWEWYRETIRTRLEPGGSIIVTATRWHEDDLTGRLLADMEQGGEAWRHVHMPALEDDGSPLWPERWDVEALERIRQSVGSRAWQAQYQGDPVPSQGGMFKRPWWQRYKVLPDLRRAELFIDSAFKDGVENDYSAVALWGTDSLGNAYVIRVWRDRVPFPDLIRMGHDAHAWAKQQFPRLRIPLVVEDKASGQSAIQVWSKPYHTPSGVLPALPVIPFKIKGSQSKIARAEGVTALVEGGRVFVPEVAPWLDDWLTEHQQFPTGKHDDQVDTTSMALTRLDLGPRRGFGVA